MVWFIVGFIIGTVNGFVIVSLAVAAHKGDEQGQVFMPTEQKPEEDFWKEGDDGKPMERRDK